MNLPTPESGKQTHSSPIHYVLALGVLLLLASCSRQQSTSSNALQLESIRSSSTYFVDQYNRQVIFNGLNLVNKDSTEHYVPNVTDSMLHQLKIWGINLIRFGLNWGMLEPKPGDFNEQYLKKIQIQVNKLTGAGIYVMLDMHQDLYSNRFGDGAADWATLDGGLPHKVGDVWSDSYLISPAVQQAFDSFWANKKVASVGLQDHYAKAWKQIARIFADNEKVIGYDLMNEPFIGSNAKKIMKRILQTFGMILYKQTGEQKTARELQQIWANEQSRLQAYKLIQDSTAFKKLLQSFAKIHQTFEKKQLQPFYQKVALAIREVDPNSILFLEHGYFSNLGVPSAIERTHRSDGSPDSLVAYAPHAYDIVTDTHQAGNAGHQRLTMIYDHIATTARQQDMPVILGEWGAFYSGGEGKMVSVANQNMQLIEQHLFSQTYWSYFDQLGQQPYFKRVLLRAVPVAVAGRLIEYKSTEPGQFTMRWNELASIEAPTIIFFPVKINLKKSVINLKSPTQWHIKQQNDSALLIIEPSDKSGLQALTIRY